MTTTEGDNTHGGYEGSQSRSEPKEPPMTKTQDELLARDDVLSAINGAFAEHMAAIRKANTGRGDKVTMAGHEMLGRAERGWDVARSAVLALAALRSPDPEVERLRGACDGLLAALFECQDKLWVGRCDSRDDGFRAAAERAIKMGHTAAQEARAALSSNSGGR